MFLSDYGCIFEKCCKVKENKWFNIIINGKTYFCINLIAFITMKKSLSIMLCAVLFVAVRAEINLANVLTSNMVLQQGKVVNIWGKADPGARLTISFAGQHKETLVNADSSWMLNLDPMPASFEPRILKLRLMKKSAETEELQLENILVGEVWICGGQSNMEYPMDRSLKRYAAPARGADLAEQEWRSGGNKNVRLMLVEKVLSLPDCTTKGWQECAANSLASFSAAAYYFGKNIQEELDVPVGLIASSWGGSRIEAWIPEEDYKEAAFYQKECSQHPAVNRKIGHFYRSMIEPLAPYALRGAIWYQGESDAMLHDSLYVEKFKLMTTVWRNIFDQAEMPFYYVQIAPYLYTNRKRDPYLHTPQTMAEFCALQTQCLELPFTGQAVVTDLVDNLTDIHPSYKWEVGRRLALWALAKDYGFRKVVYSGPVLKSAKLCRKKIVLRFDQTGSGLTAGERDVQDQFGALKRKTSLSWFELECEDGSLMSVEARVARPWWFFGKSRNRVKVILPPNVKAKSLRFAWDEKARPNFFNKEGLPAVPFRHTF